VIEARAQTIHRLAGTAAREQDARQDRPSRVSTPMLVKSGVVGAACIEMGGRSYFFRHRAFWPGATREEPGRGCRDRGALAHENAPPVVLSNEASEFTDAVGSN